MKNNLITGILIGLCLLILPSAITTTNNKPTQPIYCIVYEGHDWQNQVLKYHKQGYIVHFLANSHYSGAGKIIMYKYY